MSASVVSVPSGELPEAAVAAPASLACVVPSAAVSAMVPLAASFATAAGWSVALRGGKLTMPSRESLPSRKHTTLARPKMDPMAKPTNTMFALSPMSSSPSTETSSFAWFARLRAFIICLS